MQVSHREYLISQYFFLAQHFCNVVVNYVCYKAQAHAALMLSPCPHVVCKHLKWEILPEWKSSPAARAGIECSFRYLSSAHKCHICWLIQMWPMITKEEEFCFIIRFYLPLNHLGVAWKPDLPKTEAGLISEGYYCFLIWVCIWHSRYLKAI